jgi:hypothetical protein
LKAQAILAHARAEDRKLRKELTLEVLALKVPFGSLLGVSESSPVAGAIKGLNPYNTFDAGRARELQKSAQPATQLLSVHCLYQAIGKSARGNRFFRPKVYRDGTQSLPPARIPSAARDDRAGYVRDCERRIWGGVSFAPSGLAPSLLTYTHDLRRGLHSFAPSELEWVRTPIVNWVHFAFPF